MLSKHKIYVYITYFLDTHTVDQTFGVFENYTNQGCILSNSNIVKY